MRAFPRLLAVLGLVLALVLALAPVPGRAEEGGGGYQKIDNLVVEMWDKNGIFHTLVLQMQAYFPERPQMPKGLGEKIKREIEKVPYEELKKPEGAERIKEITKSILLADPGSAKVQDVLIQKIFFQ
jgi:hypothetical protein